MKGKKKKNWSPLAVALTSSSTHGRQSKKDETYLVPYIIGPQRFRMKTFGISFPTHALEPTSPVL
jgi:hypothetical protein